MEQIRIARKGTIQALGNFEAGDMKAYKMPLVLASHLLNEKGFQNFATRYVKVGDVAKDWVGWKT